MMLEKDQIQENYHGRNAITQMQTRTARNDSDSSRKFFEQRSNSQNAKPEALDSITKLLAHEVGKTGSDSPSKRGGVNTAYQTLNQEFNPMDDVTCSSEDEKEIKYRQLEAKRNKQKLDQLAREGKKVEKSKIMAHLSKRKCSEP